jgi:hypothetical protein
MTIELVYERATAKRATSIMAHNRILRYFQSTNRFVEIEKHRHPSAASLRSLATVLSTHVTSFQHLYAFAYERARASIASSKYDYDDLPDDSAS